MAISQCLGLVFALLVLECSGRKLPSYVTACKDDENINECAKDQAIKVLPHILKGDPKYAIPNLSPLFLPQLNIDAGSNLKLYFENTEVRGLSNLQVTDIDIDLRKRKWTVKASLKELELHGNYEIDGKILVLPITGKGISDIVFENAALVYTFEYDLETRKGRPYMKLRDPTVDLSTTKIRFNFENLFNGDKRLGDEMNKFMNENWDVVEKDLRPAFAETIQQIITNVVIQIFTKVPYDEIVLH